MPSKPTISLQKYFIIKTVYIHEYTMYILIRIQRNCSQYRSGVCTSRKLEEEETNVHIRVSHAIQQSKIASPT